jgi:hypothetical protein
MIRSVFMSYSWGEDDTGRRQVGSCLIAITRLKEITR